jgi:choline dehydrogenase-like flavoprotein
VTDHYDAVVIGSGAGGGTLARTLAMSGKRILLLERGNFLPRELCNWQPLQVLNVGRYVSPDAWYDAAGNPFEPRVHYFVGGATKLYGAALGRLRPADFGEIVHMDGVAPAWPLGYEEFEPWYAKADADIIAVRPLLSRLNVTLLVNAEVRRLETDPRGQSVTKVIVRRGAAREEYSGDIVVLAAGAVNSAKVLLQSASDRHPAGLANGSGQVGRNYMCHNVTDVVAAGEKPNETVFQQTLGVNSFYLANDPRRLSYPAGNSRRWPLGSIQMLPRAGQAAAGHGTTGPGATWCDCPDPPDVNDRAIGFRLTTEDLPRPDNRVTIDRAGRPHLAYAATNGGEAAILRRELETMLGHADLHVAAGETLPAAGLPGDAIADQAGTCRFGTDPETSVLDVNGKAHELDNLYLADASFLPSVGAVGPALTVMANAIRVGEHLVHRLR